MKHAIQGFFSYPQPGLPRDGNLTAIICFISIFSKPMLDDIFNPRVTEECILLCKKPYRLVKLFVNISEPGLGFGDLCFGRSWRHNNSYEPIVCWKLIMTY